MSAELLREASALMRERAEYAPDSPWAADVRSDGRAWIDVPDKDGHAWGMHGFPRAAEHIASWHPAVALAVAELLEADARLMEQTAFAGADWEAAKSLAVARAYLGSDS